MNRQLWIVLWVIATLFACKQTPPELATLVEIKKEINKDPSQENFNTYFTEASKLLREYNEDKQLAKRILLDGIQIADKHNKSGSSIGFLMPLIKNYPDDPNRDDNLIKLATLMNDINKDHAAITLYKAYKEGPDTRRSDAELDALIKDVAISSETYVDTFFAKVLVNPDEFGLNKVSALRFVDVAEAYALVKPDSDRTPSYLYRAAEVARSMRTLPKALSIYDWILESYPSYDKTATVLFLKGFILENDVQDIDAAREVYTTFLEKYPEHELASSVKFLIENLGKSDEEILEFIEGQRKSNQETQQ